MAAVTDKDLAKDCLLKWWEIARAMQLWASTPAFIELFGPVAPMLETGRSAGENAEEYGRRIARGLLTISKEMD